MVRVRLCITGGSGIELQLRAFWSDEEKFLAVVSMKRIKSLQPVLNSRLTAKAPLKMGHRKEELPC